MQMKDSDLTALPATAAGTLLAEFIAAYNRGDIEAVTNFISRYYGDPMAERGPEEDRAVWNAMDYTNGLWHALVHDPSCGLRIYRVEKSAPYETAVLAQCGLAGEWVYLKIKVLPEEPEHLVELRTRPALPPPNLADHNPHGAEFVPAVEEFVERLVAADVFSGTILLAKGDEPIFMRSYGLASHEFGAPNWLDTKFNVASLNKMITAVAIGQLVQRGNIAFDDLVGKHLPDLPKHIGQQATIHHLLAHLSGVGSYWNERFECERPRIRTVSDFLALFVDDPLLFRPGERWQYSNGGYIILGALIERVTGQSYYDYVREHIYAPAEMIYTDAYEIDVPVKNLAYGYTHIGPDGWLELGPRRNNLFLHVVKGGPGGGGFSTVEDLLRFSLALGQGVLLDKALTTQLLSGKVNVRGDNLRYGYGFFDRRINGQRVVGHSGNFPGIGAQFDMYVNAGYTTAILCNYDPSAAQIVADRLRDLIIRR